MATEQGVKVGDQVEFTGFTESDDMPDNADALEVGQFYKVLEISDGESEDEDSLTLEAPNPNFDDSKRASKNNPRMVQVVVFGDEVSLIEDDEQDDEQEEEDTPPKKTAAKKKAAPKKKAAAPKKKAAAKKAPAKKKAAAKKAPAKSNLKEPEQSDTDKQVAEKGMIILQEHEEDEDVMAMVSGTDDLIGLAREQVEEAQHVDYILGGILYHVRIDESYKELDDRYAEKKGFALFVEEELGVQYRKAMYLIDIYTKFNRFGIDSTVVDEIGWTKASQVARVMDEGNAEQLIDTAREQSVSELKDTISESFGKKGSDARDVVKRIGFKFRLPEASGEAIEGYLEQAKAELEMDTLDQVFEHIVTEWATENLSIKKARGGKKKAA